VKATVPGLAKKRAWAGEAAIAVQPGSVGAFCYAADKRTLFTPQNSRDLLITVAFFILIPVPESLPRFGGAFLSG
jgi:hypothetical protein